jgi:hypothetical protein
MHDVDPTACFESMREASQSENWEDAREYALDLLSWLDRGGCYPACVTRQQCDSFIAFVLREM